MEFPKIETVFQRDENHKVICCQFKNPVYSSISVWRFTEKIDGMNIRVVYTPGISLGPHEADPDVKFYGRTDNAMLPGRLLKVLQDTFTVEKMAEKFQGPVILYGEGYGAGIQKGGDLVPTDEQRFILFDVLIPDGNKKWWLNQDAVYDVATSLNIEAVPDYGLKSLEAAADFVKAGFQSRLNGGKAKAEGLVGRTIEPLFDKRGDRLIVKLKTKDF